MDPLTIEPILASRLILLDKGNGEVRPIDVGEVIRRIMGKCVSRVGKQDVIDACGATQVCAGHKSGSEVISFPEPTCHLVSAKTRSSGTIHFQTPRF